MGSGDDSPDVDVTTDATPEEVTAVFDEFSVVATGLKHGTVTVLIPGRGNSVTGGYPVEITTYRRDGTYSDNRHPDNVEFVTSLEEDLKRRDFTINAMAMDVSGELQDFHGGRKDLAKGVIRAVGDPDRRFNEDALRIMRALRFAAVLASDKEKQFEMDTETEAAVFRNKDLLGNVSPERILVEFRKLIMGRNAGIVIRRYIDVIGIVIPELLVMKGFDQHNPYHRYDILEHSIRTMEKVRGPEYMKLAALFHDAGKPETFFLDEDGIGHMYGHPDAGERIVREIMGRLKADNATTERVALLVKHHDLFFRKDERLLKKWMNRYGTEVLLEILEVKRADNFATGNMSEELAVKFDEIEKMIGEIAASGDCFSLKDLVVDGNDLKAIGIKEGKQIGEILNHLLDKVIDGEVANVKEELIAEAQNKCRSYD
jgi:tRNA nucleotidyltransferase (CCA-adding enzyme)